MDWIKGFELKFSVGSRIWQETLEEGWKTHRPKRCEYNNKDEDNSLNTINDKNYQAPSHKFKQIISDKVEDNNLKINILSMITNYMNYLIN